nr:DUF4328 domain-containing protein [Kribbella sandramycini]
MLSEEEIDRGVRSIFGASAVLNIVFYLQIATGVAFLAWLWMARENSDFFNPGRSLHRRSSGWAIGSWFCPIVQFWYPLQVVEDVVAGSAPSPEEAGSVRIRALLYGWWVAWAGYWTVLLLATGTAVTGFIYYFVRLVSSFQESEAAGSVEFYGLQDFMVGVALGVDIAFSVAAVLLVVATVSGALLMLQLSRWQQDRSAVPPATAQLPQYSQRQDFPSYRPSS